MNKLNVFFRKGTLAVADITDFVEHFFLISTRKNLASEMLTPGCMGHLRCH